MNSVNTFVFIFLSRITTKSNMNVEIDFPVCALFSLNLFLTLSSFVITENINSPFCSAFDSHRYYVIFLVFGWATYWSIISTNLFLPSYRIRDLAHCHLISFPYVLHQLPYFFIFIYFFSTFLLLYSFRLVPYYVFDNFISLLQGLPIL